MLRSLLLTSVLLLVPLAAACGEDPPPPPPPAPAPEPPPPEPAGPVATSCDRLCDRVMGCDMGDLGDRFACMRRCQLRTARDVPMLNCLAEPTPDGSPRCDLALRCVAVISERSARPEAVIPEHDRVDATALGPELQIALEARLLNASPDSSRYELVLLVRGRGQWDGGIADEDAGYPLDGGSFDGGLAGPDLWVRVGPYSSDGRLPLVRIAPRSASEDGPLFEHGSYWQRTGDYYRVRHVRDELVIEHAFLQEGHARSDEIRSDFEPSTRIRLAPGTRVTALRQIVE